LSKIYIIKHVWGCNIIIIRPVYYIYIAPVNNK